MKSQVNRRQMVRVAMLAGVVTAAAAFLPKKWMKPEVKSGVYPVHAISSNPPD